MREAQFADLDANGDGVITRDEFNKFIMNSSPSHRAPRHLMPGHAPPSHVTPGYLAPTGATPSRAATSDGTLSLGSASELSGRLDRAIASTVTSDACTGH